MPTGTVRLHRVLRAKPEKIYRAFLNADALSKWLPPYGFTCQVQHLATGGVNYPIKKLLNFFMLTLRGPYGNDATFSIHDDRCCLAEGVAANHRIANRLAG